MDPTGGHSFKPLILKICMLISTVCVAGWPRGSDTTRLRCGSDLLSDLLFVCGDRGIYLGKGSWSGYGAQPRGKGIVDNCCRSSGCDLHHLEMYCAKPKSQHHTTEQQFQTVFKKRLSAHLGPPDSPKREMYRKKTQPSSRQKSKVSSSRRKINTKHATNRTSTASTLPLHSTVTS